MLPKWSEEFGQVSGVYSECFSPLLYVFREKYKGLQSGMKQQRLSQVYFETASSQARKKRQYIAVRGGAKGGDKMGG